MTVVEALENVPIRRFHYTLLAVCSLLYAFAGMNLLTIALALTDVGRDLGLTTYQLGWVVGVLYLGMFLGALTCGRLSDIVGRKKAIVITTTIHSVFIALCSLARDFLSITVLRVLAGYGLGGLLPLPGVYISEYIPATHRGRFLGIVETSWVFGALLASGLAVVIMPAYGWRTYFLTALTPLALVPVTWLTVPESIRFLEERGRVEEAVSILRTKGLLTGSLDLTGRGRRKSVVWYRELFTDRYAVRTVVLWVLWASLVYTYHGIFVWLKKFFVVVGSIQNPLLFYFLTTLIGQVPGYFTATALLDMVGRKKVLTAYLTVAGLGCLMFIASRTPMRVFLATCVIGFGNLGAWVGLYTYTPELYPTRIRGVGSGAAASIGRIAGFIQGPVTGFILTSLGLAATFMEFTLIHVVAAVVVAALGIETRWRVLEEISE